VDGIRILLLAGAIATTMGGALYTGVRGERAEASTAAQNAVVPAPRDEELSAEPDAESEADEALDAELDVEPSVDVEASFHPAITIDIDLNEEVDDDLADYPEYLDPSDDLVLPGGVRIGRMVFGPHEEALEPDAQAEETADSEARVATHAPRRARRARPSPQPPGPRLDPDPGIHSILTARRMMASHEVIVGSCYHYLSVVYERAGHRSWRRRRIVYQEGRDGPYADLNLIRPGDWLYIVNDPGRTPVGTHSVMFVRWEDRASGQARVISHPGWGAPSAGREGTYDITRTYRIIRPTM